MADPIQTTDAVIEGGKAVGYGSGGAGLFFLLSKLAERWFSKEDEQVKAQLALLNEIKASVSNLSTDVKLVMQAHAGTRADVDKLEGIVTTLQLELATLRGKFDHLNEQLAK